MKFRIIASIVVLVVLIIVVVLVGNSNTEVGPDGQPIQTQVTQ